MKLPPLRRGTVGWIAAGVVLYGLFLVVYLPATILTDLLSKVTQNRISIVNATGSAWQGQGALALQLPGAAPASLGTITWDLRLPYLLLARLRVDTQLSDGPIAASASVVRTIHSLQLRALHARLPASQLAAMYPLLAVTNLRGDITLEAEWIRLSRLGLHGDATLTWRSAGSENFGLDSLGDYRIAVAGDMAPLRIVISTLKGDVSLQGEGNWETADNGRLTMGVAIEPRGRQPALGPLLRTWTKPVGEGRYRYDLDTTVSVPRAF